MNKRFDAYIFDMDGTLWDAVDSYAAIWNTTIVQLGVQVPPVTRQKLVAYNFSNLFFLLL